MKLSVCIFTFNHLEYISQAIESVLMQKTNFNFEIVIGEDHSTDGTREIVTSYQKKYPDKIRGYLNDKNLGVMPNNVYTLSKCRGKYIALLDGDDFWISDEKIQRQVDFLDNNPNFVLCFHDAMIFNQDGRYDSRTCCGPKQKKTVSLTDIICDTHIPTGSAVFRRQGLEGFPPKGYCDLKATDRPLFLFLSAFGQSYYFNECWSVYRKHSNGDWTKRSYQNQWLTHLQIHKFMNRHFSSRYQNAFCKCESRVSYLLALSLLRDGKIKRAKCYFRKFLRINGKIRGSGSIFYTRIFYFCLVSVAKVLSLERWRNR